MYSGFQEGSNQEAVIRGEVVCALCDRLAGSKGIYGQLRVQQNADIHTVSTLAPKRLAHRCGLRPEEEPANIYNSDNKQEVERLTANVAAEC